MRKGKERGGLLGDFLDHGVGGDVDVSGDGLVEDLVQLGENTGGAEDPVEDGARGVGGGVGAGDELGQGLGGEFFATELGAGGVAAFHQTSEEVDTGVVGHDVGLQTLVDTRHCNSCQVLNGLDAFREEAVRDIFGERGESREAAQSCGDFATAVEDLHSGGIRRGSIGRLAYLGDILALLEHAERSTEGQIADDVESKEVEPVESFDRRISVLRVALGLGDFVPLLDEQFNIVVDVLLELADRLGREGVGDGLALAGVLLTVAGVEETTADGDEGVVEVPCGS